MGRSVGGGKGMLEPCRSQIMNQKALTRLDCAVEHPMKDASPACPEPRRREGVSRPKDLHVHVSLLECAVTQNTTLSALECAVAKIPSSKSFRMRSYKKRGGGGYLSQLLYSSFQTFRRAGL